MAESSEPAGQVVGGRTGFNADEAGRQPRIELDKLPPDLPTNDDPALCINGMDLKH
jgi:hypothetical protein